jgi:hypothetical protein
LYGVKPQKLKTVSGIETPSLLTALLQNVAKKPKALSGIET